MNDQPTPSTPVSPLVNQAQPVQQAQELRSPEQVFNGDNLPDDLKWLMTSFNLPKNDPAVVLIAWHWHRVVKMQDVFRQGQMELNGILQARIDKIKEYATTVNKLDASLNRVAAEIAAEHFNLKAKVEAELKQPIAQTLKTLNDAVTSTTGLLTTVENAGKDYQRRQWRAAFWAGWASGVIIGGSICWLFFVHYFQAA